MSGKVISRTGGADRRITFATADRIAGRRLDRRKNYAIISGKVCEAASWTRDCSGCTDVGEYGAKYGPHGCSECGYSGKRIESVWLPLPAQSPETGEKK